MGEISEKQLEQYIVDHPDSLFGEESKIIGRQIPLPHGILDLLIWSHGYIHVVELKARSLKERDIGQACRYQFDVQDHLRRIGMEEAGSKLFGVEPAPPGREYYYEYIQWSTNWSVESKCIHPCLVGTAANEKVRTAAWGAGIWLYLWGGNPPTFERLDEPIPSIIPHEFAWWAEDLRDEILAAARYNQELLNETLGGANG